METLESMLLRRPRPGVLNQSGSVMTQSPSPNWQPEYEQEPPLEQVSPEDFIPNPKALLAGVAKGLPAVVGVTKWPNHIVDALRIKRLETPTFNLWDPEKKFPNTHAMVTPSGNAMELPESTIDAHVSRFLKDKKIASKPVVAPPKDILDLVNASGSAGYGSSFLPYGANNAKVHYEEVPLAQFLKKFPGAKSSKQNSYNYGIGIQGIAHGTGPNGEFLPLMKHSDVVPGSIISGYTDNAADQTIWKIK